MPGNNSIEVIDCWMITLREIMLADLKHSKGGLPAGTKIISPKSGKEWSIKHRLISGHIGTKHKKFSNESELAIYFSFGSPEKQEASVKDVVEKEKQGIFHYQIVPIGHKSKPETGEILEIVE